MTRARTHVSALGTAPRARLLLLLPLALAAAALVAPTTMATAHRAGASGPCAPAGALVEYYVGDDWWANNTLAVRPDGSATLCWWGLTNPHGRAEEHISFVLTGRTMTALKAELGRIGVRRLGPPPADWPPCCDMTFTALVYKGKVIPRDGRPSTKAAVGALSRRRGDPAQDHPSTTRRSRTSPRPRPPQSFASRLWRRAFDHRVNYRANRGSRLAFISGGRALVAESVSAVALVPGA